MKQLIILTALFIGLSCNQQPDNFTKNVEIELFPFKSGDRAYSMPKLIETEELKPFQRRLSYLLTGVPKLHAPHNKKVRDSIGSLYPDTIRVKELFLKEYQKDEHMVEAFNQSISAISNPNFKKERVYSIDQAMEVASVFFYCDKVNPDSSIQSKVCIGINGIEEAKWTDNRIILEAFCFEAIFGEMTRDSSALENSYLKHKSEIINSNKSTLINPDQYLLDVRRELIFEMKNENILRKTIIKHYELNESNLAFALLY